MLLLRQDQIDTVEYLLQVCDEAEATLKEALDLQQKLKENEQDATGLILTLRALEDVFGGTGRVDDVFDVHRHMWEIAQGSFPPGHSNRISVLQGYVNLLDAAGRFDEVAQAKTELEDELREAAAGERTQRLILQPSHELVDMLGDVESDEMSTAAFDPLAAQGGTAVTALIAAPKAEPRSRDPLNANSSGAPQATGDVHQAEAFLDRVRALLGMVGPAAVAPLVSLADVAGQPTHLSVEVPAEDDAAITGGITRAEAAHHLDMSAESLDTYGYWQPGIQAWVFVGGARAAALRRQGAAWQPARLPKMTPHVAEVLGEKPGGVTLAALPASMAHGSGQLDHVRPARASGRDVYVIGPAALWTMLDQLQSKKVGLVAVTAVRDGDSMLKSDVAITPDGPAEQCP